MYILRYLFRFNKRIWLTEHAFARAEMREISPPMIKAAVMGGRIKRFGRNRIKFIQKYKRGSVVCVGEEMKDFVEIKTVEWKK